MVKKFVVQKRVFISSECNTPMASMQGEWADDQEEFNTLPEAVKYLNEKLQMFDSQMYDIRIRSDGMSISSFTEGNEDWQITYSVDEIDDPEYLLRGR